MNFLVNAVKLYFNRNWTRQDMLSLAPIPQHARTSLHRVFLTLCCAASAAALGSHLKAGGLLTVLYSEACLLWIYFTPPWRVWRRVLPLIVAAFYIGASVVPFTKYFFEIDQRAVFRFLHGAAIVFGCFLFAARVQRERSQIYITGLIHTCSLMHLSFDISQWTLKVYVLLALSIGYLVLYSQEILYDARFGEIDLANCAFTVFFCFPAIVVHAVRLCLGAKIGQRRQN